MEPWSESGIFNPLEAGVASAPTQTAAEAAASIAVFGPGSPQMVSGSHAVLSSVLLAWSSPSSGCVFPAR